MVRGPLLLPAVVEVSGVEAAGGCLLRRAPRRVFNSRSHVPVPRPSATVCPSTGRHGETGAWILGWWRCCGGSIGFPSTQLLYCPRNPSLFRLMPIRPSGAKLLRGRFFLLWRRGRSSCPPPPLSSREFYSRVFVVMKASGSWRPVIDLSTLNLCVLKSPSKMETLQSGLSVKRGDWMVSLDLQDAYLQVPVHPDRRKFLRFMACGRVFQLKALCFGLSTAPQVFLRVMAPVSAFLHQSGIWICRYLNDWLIQASSRELVLQALDSVLRLCLDLGIVINRDKSNLVPF